ncbi:hypothetical protein FHW79_005373 [Azospirillum sp. OGB3]|uniref:hypothetical protein n=1 Tax=Azospirillum sp. OGB3 TaxID=2587012 RepID=UPI001606DD4D|nr:hypothetical protein [Azospirillum sp. OGB3]MBB3267708.1 hypothetical protein [Azospirillum sp. OGB3]
MGDLDPRGDDKLRAELMADVADKRGSWAVRSGGYLLVIMIAVFAGRHLLAPLVPATWAAPMWALVLVVLSALAMTIFCAVKRQPILGIATLAAALFIAPAMADMAARW